MYYILLFLFISCLISERNCYLPYAISNKQCASECKFYKGYYFCHLEKSWDYCSPLLNVDYYGNECQFDHPCGFHGYSYEWCNLKKGSWGYCSNGITSIHPIVTKDSYFCRDKCNEKGWCYTKPNDDSWYNWDYCEANNQNYWSELRLNKCSDDGKAVYKAKFLKNIDIKFANPICNSYTTNLTNKLILPSSCSAFYGDIFGYFEITYDNYIDYSSSLKCYDFELEDTCLEHSKSKRLKRAKKQCTSFPVSYYTIATILQIIINLINQSGQPQTSPLVGTPEPATISNYPNLTGQAISNSFEWNKRFTFRLLRSDAQETINQQREGSKYRRRQSEGNGLNGLVPTDTFGQSNLYEHVVFGNKRSQYISSTADLGRTMDLAIQQALNSFNQESGDYNGQRGHSRYFVQIDMRRLKNYDLTNADILNNNCRTPSGILDPNVVNYARRWSEVIINGLVPAGNIVRSFEVYAISNKLYVLKVINNANYTIINY